MDLLICKKNGEYLTRQDLLHTKYEVCIAKLHAYTSSAFEEDMDIKGQYCIRANLDMDTTLDVEKSMFGFTDAEFLYFAAIYELVQNIDAKYFYIFFPNENMANIMTSLLASDDNDEGAVNSDVELDLLENYRKCIAEAVQKGKNIRFLDFNTFHGYSKFFVENN